MQEILNAIKDTPIPTILVVSGILFLLLSVADQLAGKISIHPARQKVAAGIGGALILLGVGVHILPRALTPQSEVTDKIENKSEKSSDSMQATNDETRTAETQPGLSPGRRGYGTLEGRVTNEDGKAITTINTLYLEGERIGSQISNEAMGGFFQFSKRSKLSPGIYEIHVTRVQGYRPQRIKNVKIKPGVLVHIDIKLSEGDDLQEIDDPVTREID